MNDTNITSLENEIESEFACLEEMEIGSEPYKVTVDGLTKLIDRSINLKKIDIECEQKRKEYEMAEQKRIDAERAESANHALKVKQMDNERKDKLFDKCMAIASVAVPTVVTIWGTIVTLKFEETGSVTTIMGRGFIGKLLPKK